MRKREPCSVDIWSYKVVQKSSKTQIEANKPHVFYVYNHCIIFMWLWDNTNIVNT